MRTFRMAGLLIATCLGLSGCVETSTSSYAQTTRTTNALAETNNGLPVDVRVGDTGTSYASVEFTRDGRYMVWFEGVGGNRTGKVWHCAVDAATGTLNPPNCKGFSAFPATAFGRANVGYDASGPYYIGSNTAGEIVMVRPTGATTGRVTKLSTPADTSRAGFYPSQITDRTGGYLVWIKRLGTAKELQYIDLANPSVVHTIERQSLAGGMRLTPMEIGFYRLVNGRPLLTYGAFDGSRKLQVKMKDLSRPNEPARFVTSGSVNLIDSYGFVAPNGGMYLVSGVNGEARMNVYRYSTSSGMFVKQGEFGAPASSQLANPFMATSFEPIFRGGRILGTYQVNEGPPGGIPERTPGAFQGRTPGAFQGRPQGAFQGRTPGAFQGRGGAALQGGRGGGAANGYISTAFQKPGEIWLVDITDPSRPQVRLSGSAPLIRTEPEPLPGSAWVFYNAAPEGSTLLDATWQLRRSQVP